MTRKLFVLVSLFILSGTPVVANPVERACLGSDREAASRTLCSCIGSVARQTLSRSEQRRAARFFDDPDEAQEVRMSDRRSDEEFWDNYQAFGASAQASCG